MKINVNKDDLEMFNNSEIGSIKNNYLKRAKIIGIICIATSIIWGVLNYYYSLKWYEYIAPTTLLLFGFYFIINSNIIKKKEVNIYADKLKKTQK